MFMILGGLAGILVGCAVAYVAGRWWGKRIGEQAVRDLVRPHRRP